MTAGSAAQPHRTRGTGGRIRTPTGGPKPAAAARAPATTTHRARGSRLAVGVLLTFVGPAVAAIIRSPVSACDLFGVDPDRRRAHA